MKPLIAAFFILLTLSSCHRKKMNKDRYYTDHGDWDDVRFPLIKPYEALCLNGSKDWIVQTTPDVESLFSVPGTRKVNVVNHMIFLYSTKTILNSADAKEAWFVLIPDQHIEKGFATHAGYLDYLRQLNISHEPELYDMNRVLKYFDDHDNIDWQHIEN